MALYTGRILMRIGNEANYDIDKLMPGEWAVSTDKRIVRICVSAGIGIRMATYEAFEEDMAKIEKILNQCQTIQEAIVRIITEVSEKADAVAEYTASAKQYRDEAEQFKNESEQFKNEAFSTTPEGYETLVQNVADNTVKIDTVINKAELNIKNTASGDSIHLTDSADGKIIDFSLYGIAKQMITTGKSLAKNVLKNTTNNGVTFTLNEDGSNTMNGTSTGDISLSVLSFTSDFTGMVKLTGCQGSNYWLYAWDNSRGKRPFTDSSKTTLQTNNQYAPNKEIPFYVEEGVNYSVFFRGFPNYEFKNEVMYPMLSIEGGEYEPYTNGASPNPDYPQEIEVSGDSYNILNNTLTTTTVRGVTFTVNEDKSITVNGTASGGNASVMLTVPFKKGRYVATGCPTGGSSATYSMIVQKSDGSGTTLFETGSGITFDIEEDNTVMWIYPVRIVNGVKVENLTFYPMIRKITEKRTKYVPYGQGSVEVKSCGKNYYDISKTVKNPGVSKVEVSDNSVRVYSETAYAWTSSYYEIDYTKMKKGKTYTLSADVLVTKGSGRLTLRDSSSIKISSKNITSSGKYSLTFQLPDYECYISLFATTGTTEIGDVTYSNIQVEEGDKVTDYEPYKETISTIQTPNGRAGIPSEIGGNYTDETGQQWVCDEVVKYTDGSGEKIQRIKKFVLDGVNENFVSTRTYGKNLFFTSRTEDSYQHDYYSEVPNVISSHFRRVGGVTATSTEVDSCLFIYPGGIGIEFCFGKNSEITTLNAANAWLKENPVTVYYELAEPIRTPLTADEIAEIEKLHTFYPVTNITNDSKCGMKVTYLADLKNYTDNQLAAQAQAQEAALIDMLLLMPEETQAAMIEKDTNNLLMESEE